MYLCTVHAWLRSSTLSIKPLKKAAKLVIKINTVSNQSKTIERDRKQSNESILYFLFYFDCLSNHIANPYPIFRFGIDWFSNRKVRLVTSVNNKDQMSSVRQPGCQGTTTLLHLDPGFALKLKLVVGKMKPTGRVLFSTTIFSIVSVHSLSSIYDLSGGCRTPAYLTYLYLTIIDHLWDTVAIIDFADLVDQDYSCIFSFLWP